jgi:hypothetical protein
MTKTIFITLTALFLLFLDLSAQNKFIFSIAANGGLTFTAKEYAAETGWNSGVEFETRKKNIGVFFNSLYSNCPIEQSAYEHEYGAPTNKKNIKILELTIGPRAYFGDLNKFNGNVEIGMGYYGFTTSNKAENFFGFNVGAGFSYPVSRNIDILTRGKIHVNEQFADQHFTTDIGIKYHINK